MEGEQKYKRNDGIKKEYKVKRAIKKRVD